MSYFSDIVLPYFLEHLPECFGVSHLNSQATDQLQLLVAVARFIWPGGAGLVTTESSSDGQGPEAHHSRQGAPSCMLGREFGFGIGMVMLICAFNTGGGE